MVYGSDFPRHGNGLVGVYLSLKVEVEGGKGWEVSQSAPGIRFSHKHSSCLKTKHQHDHTGEENLGILHGDTLNTFRSAGIDQQVSRDNVSVEVIFNI